MQMNEDKKVCSCKWIKWINMFLYVHVNVNERRC